ncbi:MAG: Response regulator receiver domain-containing protein [uncultured Thiotrichaceae bacterium]|uniref:Response regulator receiver domain-containing protein n=1 Tax=uncultured Thiotrichaceae bacterium TaxID=298394 RepID=A0A6S6THZ8_9GAMM|nr:MAG: Response regulator receiver domain-containing protein [uncultured Thiotrichaceae bacterium]
MQSTAKVIDFNRIHRASLNATPGKKPKILFVDDEERILNTMQALFRRRYDTTTTTDGYHALELLQQDHYHLLISDQRMPVMAGVDLLREAKSVSPDTMRILLTGYSDLAAIIGSVNDGEVFRFLNKPWNTQEFVSTVDEAVKIGLELQEAANEAPSAPLPPAIDLSPQPDSDHPSEPEASTVPQPVESLDAADENIIVLRGDSEILALIRSILPGCRILEANDYDETINLMLRHEIGVIVSNLDDDYEDTLEFFSLLKNEHPQVVSILLANSGDSTTLIHLINHARVFRYMFKPIRERLLKRYLNAAIEQYQTFKIAPTLLKQQKAQEKLLQPDNIEEAAQTQTANGSDKNKSTSVPVTQDAPNLRGKMRKIRSFFSRLISG